MNPKRITYTLLESPLGEILIAGTQSGLTRIAFQEGTRAIEPPAEWLRDDEALSAATIQIHEYFEGSRRVFDLALSPAGTPFQLKAWKALVDIPYGQTATYGDQANRIGRATASRAVGAANGKNPLPIVLPCHRVIAKSGNLTGYAGGLRFKAALLELEHSHAGEGQLSFST